MSIQIEHKFVDGVELKRCSCCKEWLSLDKYCKGRKRKDGLYDNCRICKQKREEASIKPLSEDTLIVRYYNYYKRNAKNRKLSFELSKEEFKNLILGCCYYCGDAPSFYEYKMYKRRGILAKNGIDRVNNFLGYVTNNCVTCCEICNKMKLTLTQEEFYARIIKIYENTIIVNKEV